MLSVCSVFLVKIPTSAPFTPYEAGEEHLAFTLFGIMRNSTLSALTSTRTHSVSARGGQRAQSRADVRVEKGHHNELCADGKFSFMKMASQIRWWIFRWLHLTFSLIFCVYDAPRRVPFAHGMSSTAASSPCSPRSSPAFGCCSHFYTVRRWSGHVISTLRHQADIWDYTPRERWRSAARRIYCECKHKRKTNFAVGTTAVVNVFAAALAAKTTFSCKRTRRW